MKTLLITPAEVLALSFSPKEVLSEEMINESHILVAQITFLKPVLGALYSVLDEERYAAFVQEQIKPALAFFVRSRVIEELAVTLSPMGAMQLHSDFSTGTPLRERLRLRRHAVHVGRTLLAEAVAEIESDAAAYPEYDPRENLMHGLSLCGGIILPTDGR